MRDRRSPSNRVLSILELVLVMSAVAVGTAGVARAEEGTGKEKAREEGESGRSPSNGSDEKAVEGKEDSQPADDREGEEEKEGVPAEVVVGVYVNQIREVSIRNNQFKVDFWIWFRSKKDVELDPLKSFEVVGGDIDSKGEEIRQDLGDWNYAAVRVVATIIRFFDVAEFPNDAHEIAIVIEDTENEDHKVHFVADEANSRLDPAVQVPGFRVIGANTGISSHTYTTNYGDVTLPSNSESRYSRFEMRIGVERPGFGYSMKLLWGMWLSALIAFIAMFIKATEVDPRFGVGVGGIFAAMANQFIISSSLPETSQVTTADIVGMLTIGFIFLSLLESTLSLWMHQHDREREAMRLDKIAFGVLMSGYIALNASVMLSS